MSYRTLNTDDLRKRLDELEDMKEEAERVENGEDSLALSAEEEAERKELRDMEEGIADWQYGETLIAVRDFKEYTKELAEELGYIDYNSWPYTCIDWEQAADELAQDYSEYTYLGVNYYAR